MKQGKTRLYLVRHAAFTGREGAFPGPGDPGLSAAGESQARLLASRLSGARLDALYASDLRRAFETAEILGGPLGLSPSAEPSFREVNVGRWAGLDFSEIEAASPGAFNEWCENPASFRPPGGESLVEMAARVLARAGELLAAHRRGSFMVVAHGGVNRVLLADALGIDPQRAFSLEQDFACLNIVDYYEDGIKVVKLLNARGLFPEIEIEPGTSTLILGGARSGKSDLALSLAAGIEGPRYFVATAEALDDEMARRIEAHKELRGGDWTTIEEPVEVERALRGLPGGSVVVLDCLTLWLSNLLHSLGPEPDRARERVESLADALPSLPITLIMVSNEVGAGIVPADPSTRAFRDLAGFTNRRLAERAHRAILTVAGQPVVLK